MLHTPTQLRPDAEHIPTRRERMMAIVAAVADRHGVSTEALLSRSQRRPVVIARYDAMRAVKIAYPDMSTPRVAKLFERHHSMAGRAFGWRRYSRALKQEPLDRIIAQLGGPLPR